VTLQQDSAAAVRVSGLTHRYGSKLALSDLDFTLERGRFLALLGPNGAGKSTLFSLLTRLLEPQGGRIELFGHPLPSAPAAALRRLGVVFQQSTLDLDLTVAQNLAYHGALQGMSRRDVQRRGDEELERFSLRDRRGDRVRELNGGHRRRVEVARALLHEPQLLLLDEASAGLDLESRTALYRHVRQLCTERGMAVLWTTHLVEELAENDDTLVLSQGRAVARGSLSSLREQNAGVSASEAILAITGAQRA
jgi:ABC-2 type transport system ATP-binding protein